MRVNLRLSVRQIELTVASLTPIILPAGVRLRSRQGQTNLFRCFFHSKIKPNGLMVRIYA